MNDTPKFPAFPDDGDLHAYVDGRLDEAGCRRVEAWLARDPDRAEMVRGWQCDAQELRAALGALPGSPGLASLDPAAVRHRHRKRIRARFALAAMLVLVMSAGGFGGWQARSMQSAARPAPMADALQAYRLFALDRYASLDVTQRHAGELQAWLNRHFPDAAALPNLEASGFRLAGGRLLATDSGPAALVLYENAKGIAVTFYIRSPAPHAGMLARGERREGQLAAAYWSGNGYNYALVSLANPDDLGVISHAANLESSR